MKSTMKSLNCNILERDMDNTSRLRVSLKLPWSNFLSYDIKIYMLRQIKRRLEEAEDELRLPLQESMRYENR